MNVLRKLACGVVCAVAFVSSNAGLLPEGYSEVEYIQGNGKDARILTNYTPVPSTDKIEAVIDWPNDIRTTHEAIWCAREASTTKAWSLFYIKDNKKFRFDYGETMSSLVPKFEISSRKYTITATNNTITYFANGKQLEVNSTTEASYTVGGPVMLFASYYNGTNNGLGNYGTFRLYSFKVWRDDNLIHYFVPCKDSGGNATLYDICNDPATLVKSGTFYAGPEGSYHTAPLFAPVTVSERTSSHASISCELSSLGFSATSADIQFVYTDGTTTNIVPLGEKSAPTELKVTLDDLSVNTSYTCWFIATNNAATPLGSDSVHATFKTKSLPVAGVFMCDLSFPSAPANALENFPVLVRLAEDSPSGFSYGQCPESGNLWFCGANDVALPFEVDTWNTSGESLVWVSVPSLSSSSIITMCWSPQASLAPVSPASTEVWARAKYVGVWHMNKILANADASKHYTPDSSASGWDAYKNNESDENYPVPVTIAPGASASPIPPTGTAMNIAYGAGYSNTDSGAFLVPKDLTSATTLNGPGFTLSAVVNSHQIADNGRGRAIAFGIDHRDMANITVGSDNIHCMGPVGSNSYSSHSAANPKGATGWVYAAAVFGKSSFIYADGVLISPVTGDLPDLTSMQLTKGIGIGCFANGTRVLDGYMDEVRIRSVQSSADWIAEESKTVMSADYVSFGELDSGFDIPQFGPIAISGLTAASVTITGELRALGEGTASANVWLVYTDGVATNEVSLSVKDSVPAALSVTLGTLSERTSYTCWFKASSNTVEPVVGASASASFCTLCAGRTLQDNLPDGYKRLEYVQGDGKTGYFVANFSPDPSKDTIVVEAELTQYGNNVEPQALFESADMTAFTTEPKQGVVLQGAGLRFDYGEIGTPCYSHEVAATVGKRITYMVTKGSIRWTGGMPIENSNPAPEVWSGPLQILGFSYEGKATFCSSIKLYSLKIYRNKQLIHDFVPVLDDQSMATLYDLCDTSSVERRGTINPGPVMWLTVEEIPAQKYKSGQVVEPHPIVFDNESGNMLEEGLHYTLSWADNDAVGKGTVIITGIGYFSGKTHTERFRIVPNLPSGFKAVEYVHSSGEQFVDTGFTPDQNTRADIRFLMHHPALSSLEKVYSSPFGARNENNLQFFVGASHGGEYYFSRHGNGATDLQNQDGYVGTSSLKNHPSIVGYHKFSLNRNIFTLDEYKYSFSSSVSFTCDRSAYVFATHGKDGVQQPATMELYSLKIWDNDELVRDLVPCVKVEGGVEKVGLYDLCVTAEKRFYENGGSGAPLVAGPEIDMPNPFGFIVILR